MDAKKFSSMQASRRNFLTGLAALGAVTLVPSSSFEAQQRGGGGGGGGQRGQEAPLPPPSGPAVGRRIDVHQHFVSPDYLAILRSQPQGSVGLQVSNTFR